MITHTLGPWYTGEADFPLTDVRCERSLSEFAPWLYTAGFSETVVFSDGFVKVRRMTFREAVTVMDRYKSGGVILLRDGLAIAETLSHTAAWKRLFRESLAVEARPVLHTRKHFTEGITAGDRETGAFQKVIREPVPVVEALKAYKRFTRTFQEGLRVQEAEYAAYRAAYKETVTLLDELVRAMNGVLSEAIIREGEMNLAQFKELSSSPIGYAPFVDFRVGDYEYKEALYRFTVEKKELSLNMALHDLVVHVDIPDTNDRGRAAIPAEVTKVYYNKHYYTPPEVVASVVGGTEGTGVIIPFVLSTDKEDEKGRYFEVILRNAAGKATAGTIIWTSKGY